MGPAAASGTGSFPRRSGVVRGAAALVSAALYALAQPPFEVPGLAWVCLVPLLLACSGVGAACGAGLGALFGLAAAAAVTPWLPGMVADYFQVGALAAWPTAFAAWCVLAVPAFAGFGAFVAWGARRGTLHPLSIAAAFVLAELVRSHGPVAGPWALLAYAQATDAPISQLAELAGPSAPGFVMSAASAAIAALLAPTLAGGRAVPAAVGTALLVTGAFGFGTLRLRAPGPDPAQLVPVALVQSAVDRSRRFEPDFRAANLAHHLVLSETVARGGARVLFWPELALDFPVEGEPGLRAQLERSVAELGVELVAGGLGVRDDGDGPRYANAVFLVRDGMLLGRTDKVHLMPFSETDPLARLRGGRDPFAAGERPHLLHTRAGRIGVVTCSEAMHPNDVRRVVALGAEVLANPSNDDWFGGARAARQPLRAAALRAVETRRWLVRPVLAGHSVVIDPFGRTRARAPYGEPTALAAAVAPRSELTIYVRSGDFLPALAAAALVAPVLRRGVRGAAS